MMIKYIFLSCMILLLFSCQNNKHTNVDSLIEIDLDDTNSESPSIKEIYYIPLETSDSSLIADIDKIVFRNNCFYIFDKVNMKVFIFDRGGALKNIISRVGTGPGEYIMPLDMDVDKHGNVYISDNPTKRIIKYAADNYDNYEVIDIGEYCLDFAILNDESVYIGDSYKDGIFNIKLARFNIQTKKFEVLRKNEIESNKVIPRFARHYLFRSGEKIYYYERFSPFLFSIIKEEIRPDYFLKSQKYPSESIIDEWKKDVGRITLSKEYIRDISSFYEAGEYIRLTVFSAFPTTTLLNVKNSKVYNLNIINDERFYGIMGVNASDRDYFVSYFQPEQKTINDILSHNNQIDAETRDKLQRIPEDSNPVIVLFNYN